MSTRHLKLRLTFKEARKLYGKIENPEDKACQRRKRRATGDLFCSLPILHSSHHNEGWVKKIKELIFNDKEFYMEA